MLLLETRDLLSLCQINLRRRLKSNFEAVALLAGVDLMEADFYCLVLENTIVAEIKLIEFDDLNILQLSHVSIHIVRKFL